MSAAGVAAAGAVVVVADTDAVVDGCSIDDVGW